MVNRQKTRQILLFSLRYRSLFLTWLPRGPTQSYTDEHTKSRKKSRWAAQSNNKNHASSTLLCGISRINCFNSPSVWGLLLELTWYWANAWMLTVLRITFKPRETKIQKLWGDSKVDNVNKTRKQNTNVSTEGFWPTEVRIWFSLSEKACASMGMAACENYINKRTVNISRLKEALRELLGSFWKLSESQLFNRFFKKFLISCN